VSLPVEVALPFWLDRPDEEAADIAVAAEQAGAERVWIGEMASFDAFALGTAIGLRTERIQLTIGPLAVAVRTPVGIALGISSVRSLTGHRVNVALGSSSPLIVAGWHDRDWTGLAGRMQESVAALRGLFAGGRIELEGKHVRTHGFRMRRPCPETEITVAAFGPAVTRVAARHADEAVLNLVPPDRVARVRAALDTEAALVDRTPPRLAVWVPAALSPGEAARSQLAEQLSLYLAAPGYAEQFTELGFGALVQAARSGVPRRELAKHLPLELAAAVGAIGDESQIADRIAEYEAAGADSVALVPSTAEDPAGTGLLGALARERV
jgi:probable F420-dependent oxidoreductase